MKSLVDRFDDQFVVGEAEVGILLANVRFQDYLSTPQLVQVS